MRWALGGCSGQTAIAVQDRKQRELSGHKLLQQWRTGGPRIAWAGQSAEPHKGGIALPRQRCYRRVVRSHAESLAYCGVNGYGQPAQGLHGSKGWHRKGTFLESKEAVSGRVGGSFSVRFVRPRNVEWVICAVAHMKVTSSSMVEYC